MASARCTLCHRVEDWSPTDGGWTRVERAAGGARRASAPERQAFDIVVANGGRVVAACPACGQPMLAEDAAATGSPPPIPWRFAVPGGAITLSPDGAALGPQGPLPRAEAVALIGATHHAFRDDPQSNWTLAFQIGLLVLLLVPLAVWLFSVFFVTLFLSHAGEAL